MRPSAVAAAFHAAGARRAHLTLIPEPIFRIRMEGYSSQGISEYGVAVAGPSPTEGRGEEGEAIELQHQQDEQQQEIDSEDTWAVVGAFFEGKGLVSQQVESFNDFASYKLQEIIDAHPPIEIR